MWAVKGQTVMGLSPLQRFHVDIIYISASELCVHKLRKLFKDLHACFS